MRFGYACLNMSTNMGFKTCRLATVQKEGISKVKELSLLNLNLILENIAWNIQNNIYFYRMTSGVIPFVTHEIFDKEVQWDWENDKDILSLTNRIKEIVNENNVRLTVHPGQHSPLNTPRENVLKNTLADFEYHSKLLDLMGGTDMITHVGGAYGDKESAKDSFVRNYNLLSDSIKDKLRLENDDKTFTVEDTMDIFSKCGVPICLDIHHHNCNPGVHNIRDLFINIYQTWEKFGTPKTHISSGKKGKTDKAHADYIREEDLLEFLDIIGDYDVDIMFEAKHKELSVLKFTHLQKFV